MQTRKRAKTITFGKKGKEETEEVTTPAVESPKPADETPETTEEKAETVERRTLAEKPQPSELSATLPPTSDEGETPELSSENATPSNEFITDEQPSTSPEPVAPSTEEPKESESEPESTTTEPELQTSLSPETPAPTATSPELSPTPPETPVETSAFTIQNDEKEHVADVGEGGKKRFGLYFFLVAFLAFILGLGAMAAITYGWVTIPGLNNLKLPKALNVPGLPATQPTPTLAPTAAPVAATPTEKAVDLKAYTITVLNGSGVVGKAAEVKTSLTTAGFKVGTTGNADKSDYTKTQIAAKKNVDKDYLTKLEAELKKSFDVAEPSTAPDSDTSDVTVTIGKSTAQ